MDTSNEDAQLHGFPSLLTCGMTWSTLQMATCVGRKACMHGLPLALSFCFDFFFVIYLQDQKEPISGKREESWRVSSLGSHIYIVDLHYGK